MHKETAVTAWIYKFKFPAYFDQQIINRKKITGSNLKNNF